MLKDKFGTYILISAIILSITIIVYLLCNRYDIRYNTNLIKIDKLTGTTYVADKGKWIEIK